MAPIHHRWPVKSAALLVALGVIPATTLAAHASVMGKTAAHPVAAKPAPPFIRTAATVRQVGSTVPASGDLNPYGVAVVPVSTGSLHAGHVLVSNFNNSKNLGGTGTTIVDFAPSGKRTTFATIVPSRLLGKCPGGVGLTTGLAVLRSGWVVVGSLPTGDGTAATARAGCLIILNSRGQLARTISGAPIHGPWDLTALDQGNRAVLFVSNVLNGLAKGSESDTRGSVVRITLDVHRGLAAPRVMSWRTIATGLAEKTDPAALVVGPTGLGLSRNGTLYVADTMGNRVLAISQALTRMTAVKVGRVVSTGKALNGPLGLAIAGNGDILTVNANDGNLVETTPAGKQIAVKALDTTGTPAGAGTLFGLAVAPGGRNLYFGDDGSNTLNLLH